jgi:hypothetical protein
MLFGSVAVVNQRKSTEFPPNKSEERKKLFMRTKRERKFIEGARVFA